MMAKAATPTKGLIQEANKQLQAMHQQMQEQEEGFRLTVEEKDMTISSLRETVSVLQHNVRTLQDVEENLKAKLAQSEKEKEDLRTVMSQIGELAQAASTKSA
eukprot:TRINITY_DN6561_c0_g1_i1.p1 TRINITY_DN6561_c0_g1~~TRINITY_DN6561_c0_g1_i1.p1  ORF type:complete len:103 (+),score=26.83 TRINITY_DN6561_c0_g1_i1:1-309(+)